MKTILIVEDDYYIRDIYQRTFSKGGYSVDVAVDGQEGVDKTHAGKYDLVLLDIMLPHVTGIDVLRSIRSDGSVNQKTPVYLITNLGQEEIIKEAFSIGADGYLIKSQLRPAEVLNEINLFFQQSDSSDQPQTIAQPPTLSIPVSVSPAPPQNGNAQDPIVVVSPPTPPSQTIPPIG